MKVPLYKEQAQCIMDLPDDKYRMEMKKEIKKTYRD